MLGVGTLTLGFFTSTLTFGTLTEGVAFVGVLMPAAFVSLMPVVLRLWSWRRRRRRRPVEASRRHWPRRDASLLRCHDRRTSGLRYGDPCCRRDGNALSRRASGQDACRSSARRLPQRLRPLRQGRRGRQRDRHLASNLENSRWS